MSNANDEHDAAYSREIQAAIVRYKDMSHGELLECQRQLRIAGGMPTHYNVASLEVLRQMLMPIPERTQP